MASAMALTGLLAGAGIVRAQADAGRDPAQQAVPPDRPADERPWAAGVPADEQERALALFRVGNGHFEESRYPQALAEYRKALAVWDHPAIHYNLAVCLVHLDRPVEALEGFERSLRFGESPLGPRQHAQAKTYRKLLLGQLGHLDVRCSEPGAQVTLDGQPLFAAPGAAERVLATGGHQVVAGKPGYVTVTRDVRLGPGERLVVDLELIPLGQAVEMTRRFPTWAPWTVLGIGAVAAAAAVPLYLAAGSGMDEHDRRFADLCEHGCFEGSPPAEVGSDPPAIPGELTDLETRARVENASAVALWSVGGAAVVTGVVMLVLNRPRPVPTGADQGPTATSFVSPGGTGVVVGGGF